MAREKRRLGLHKPELVIHTVLTNQNADLLPDFFDLANAIGVSRVDIDELIAYRPEQKALELTETQRKRLPNVAQSAIQVASQYNIEHRLEQYANARPTSRGKEFLYQAKEQANAAGDLKKAPCLKAWHHFVIQADGRTSPCCVLAGEGGSAQDQALKTVWETDHFLKKFEVKCAFNNPQKGVLNALGTS